MIRNVETVLQEHLPQGQMTDLPTSNYRPRPTEARTENHMIVRYSSASKTDSDKKTENRSPGALERSIRVNQLIDIAITVRYRQGKASFNAIAIKDQGFEEADFRTKRQMVKLLQDLRLLIWLFTRNANFGTRLCGHAFISQIPLVFETNIGLSWNFWRWREMVQSGRLPRLQPERLSEFLEHVSNRSRYEHSEAIELRRIIIPVERKYGSSLVSHQANLDVILSAEANTMLKHKFVSSRLQQLFDIYPYVAVDRTRALQLDLLIMSLDLCEVDLETSMLEMRYEMELIQTNISFAIDQAFRSMR